MTDGDAPLASAIDVWLHDMRNAINTAGMSAAVARRLVEDGDTTRALEFLRDVEQACERCRALSAAYPGRCGDRQGNG